MRILVVYQTATMPSSRIRIIQLAPFLEQLGFELTLSAYDDITPEQLQGYDAVILQKKTLAWWPRRAWAKLSCPLIFDFDDAIFFRDKAKSGSFKSRTRERRFKHMMQLCDAVICGNQYLASFCLPDKPQLIAPSPVPHQVPLRDYSKPSQGPLRLGWVGGGANLRMLDSIAAELIELNRQHPMELHILSDQEYQHPGIKVVNQRWSLQVQDDFLASLDLGLMPLEDTPWTRGKCSYKLLQYMAAGVVAVGSDLGMNREIIEHKHTGLLAGPKDWAQVISAALAQPESLAEIGEAGRQSLLERFTYPQIAQQWATFLRSLQH